MAQYHKKMCVIDLNILKEVFNIEKITEINETREPTKNLFDFILTIKLIKMIKIGMQTLEM